MGTGRLDQEHNPTSWLSPANNIRKQFYLIRVQIAE